MKTLLNILLPCALLSCTSQTEFMTKANGDRYLYHVGQVGGKVVAKSSMGTELAADDENSFQVAAQALVSYGLSLEATKVALASEVTKRYEMGQITLREANALKAQIALAQSSNELTAFIAGLPK